MRSNTGRESACRCRKSDCTRGHESANSSFKIEAKAVKVLAEALRMSLQAVIV
jgi:hypothetical protein